MENVIPVVPRFTLLEDSRDHVGLLLKHEFVAVPLQFRLLAIGLINLLILHHWYGPVWQELLLSIPRVSLSQYSLIFT